jgi:hypothetical protein
MDEPALEPDRQRTRAEMAAQLAWIVGPLGAVWVGATLVTKLFPNWSPYWQLAVVVIPVAAVLYGIGIWRKRQNA